MRRGGAFVALLCFALAPAAAQAEPVEAGAGFGGAGLTGCRTDLRYLNQLFGWQMGWQREWQALTDVPDEAARAAITHWESAPAALQADEAALAEADREPARAAPRIVVERVLAELDDLVRALQAGPPPLRADVAPETRAAWRALFADRIAPAVAQYRDFLRGHYLPRASGSAGLSGTADGPHCFRQSVRYFTSVDLPPAEIEAIGRRLLRASGDDLARLYRIDRARLPRLLARLRALREPGFTAARLTEISRAAIARAGAAMPLMFLGRAAHPVTVEALPAAAEASAAAGFYRPAQNGRPAAYVINLSRPQERRLMAEVIAFHETLPGHHAQAALDLPVGAFNSGFAEGWALYSEYVADEMHLYSGRIDRAGMMAKHLWAASRLIVEPGLHLHGWSRARAIAFMRQHTALSDAEIAVEVDRYIATPGQSLSYMLGYDRIAGARRYAERVLGRRFDLRRFHDVVLGRGARGLDRVHADVVRWAGGGGGAG
ncbi:MAG: DUF885 domain-containing protein [Sphingomonadaceae bacterium]|nr:DUF885 domain-containing protein [Sphingomonadaceae bacterium]